jgi:hypothetical protein
MVEGNFYPDVQVWLSLNDYFLPMLPFTNNHLRVLVVRVPGYKSKGPASIAGLYQSFWEVVRMEWGQLSLVSAIEELFKKT